MNDSFTFTVGKVDAGMAILIGERAHLIEFPSLLLPPGVSSGSIVNIAVHRNVKEETRQSKEFWELQDQILNAFGVASPEAPKLEVRNVTQTSVTLEWPPLQLATAKLRSLDIYRNDQRLAAIPQPLQNTSTKLSSLELDTNYTFHLVLRTTSGTFQSNVLNVRTHKITNTSGISVCFGATDDPQLVDSAKAALTEMGARWSDKIQIDTTHFVCTTPTPPGRSGPSVEYQRAVQLSIPVVQPQWVLACQTEKRMVPIGAFYLGMTPPQPARPSQSPTTAKAPPSSAHARGESAPVTAPSRGDAFVNQAVPPRESGESEEAAEAPVRSPGGHVRAGTMAKDFKFPPGGGRPPHVPRGSVAVVEVPPPPPVEKETSIAEDESTAEGEDVGETVEVDLS